ncbi:MAG: hypothetical protein EOP04_12865 [Proteobacteria bacterium]|nr:MAG: hypothetical protein EOP04_12865 [Pseudomonadota bacterium]
MISLSCWKSIRPLQLGSSALATLITLSLSLAAFTPAAKAQDYEGSTFSEVWAAANENPYSALPEEKVTLRSFYHFLSDKLQKSSERTLSDHNDVLPYFQKLLHPNAICFAGTWNITEETDYSGYFKKDSKGLIILRASAALSEIHRGEKRAFGMAGKIFPTDDFAHQDKLKTANFFVIDNLGGTYAENFLDSPMTNDITNIDFGAENIGQTGILAAAVKAFGFAEKVVGTTLTVRQLYEISELGESKSAIIKTPKYLKLQGQEGQRTDLSDFREDLRIQNNGGLIRIDISIASEGSLGKPKNWTKVGYIELTEDSLAEGCDHRVHFHHPGWRHNLN